MIVQLRGLGFPWTLIVRYVATIAQAIVLGYDTVQAVKSADEATGEQMTPQDVPAVASELSKRFPTIPQSSWQSLLGQAIQQRPGTAAPPAALPCAPGFLRDPASGACIEVKQAGMGMPTWGWFAIGALGLMFLMQSGMLQPRAR